MTRNQVVRHALRSDVDELEITLGDAFADDPMLTWMYPDDVTREAFARGFFRVALDVGLTRGHTYTIANNAVAVWSPPDIDLFDDPSLERLGVLLGEQIGDRSVEVFAGLGRIADVHPHEIPHFYLLALGTRAAQRSRGLGARLLDDVLRRCDAQGLPAYLESSNIRNVSIYERHGFRVLDELHIGGDFVARPMWRDPQPPR
jgi:ribosomal protein S18 acetylase RimI-like enzyme